MKLQVWGEPQEPPEKAVQLRLVQYHNSIILMVVNDKGEHESFGRILVIRNGRIERSKVVNPSFGFDLDAAGRVRLLNDRIDNEPF